MLPGCFDEGSDHFVSELNSAGFLTDSSTNEFEMALAASRIARFAGDEFCLTIATTSVCHFSCRYCYEQGINQIPSGFSYVDTLYGYIKRKCGKHKKVAIYWYGGEPLLATNVITELTDILLADSDIASLRASVITNGFYLDEKTCHLLKEAKVESIQVTLDGPKLVHDARRHLRSGSGTFDTIISNLKHAVQFFKIYIRVNLDKCNSKSALELFDELEAAGLKEKIVLYTAMVDSVSGCYGKCMSTSQYVGADLDFSRAAIKKGFSISLLNSLSIGICGAVSGNSVVVDPSGRLYKCWDEVCRLSCSFASITSEECSNQSYAKWINYDPPHGECENCSVFPVCMGGCPKERMSRDTSNCDPIRYSIQEKIRLRALLHRMKGGRNA